MRLLWVGAPRSFSRCFPPQLAPGTSVSSQEDVGSWRYVPRSTRRSMGAADRWVLHPSGGNEGLWGSTGPAASAQSYGELRRPLQSHFQAWKTGRSLGKAGADLSRTNCSWAARLPSVMLWLALQRWLDALDLVWDPQNQLEGTWAPWVECGLRGAPDGPSEEQRSEVQSHSCQPVVRSVPRRLLLMSVVNVPSARAWTKNGEHPHRVCGWRCLGGVGRTSCQPEGPRRTGGTFSKDECKVVLVGQTDTVRRVITDSAAGGTEKREMGVQTFSWPGFSCSMRRSRSKLAWEDWEKAISEWMKEQNGQRSQILSL